MPFVIILGTFVVPDSNPYTITEEEERCNCTEMAKSFYDEQK
jgi:hypothetical protein